MDIVPGKIETEVIHYDTVDFDAIDKMENIVPEDLRGKTEDVSKNDEPQTVKEIPLKDEEDTLLEEEASPQADQEKKDETDLDDVEKMAPSEEKAEFRTLKLKDGKDFVEVNQDATFKFKIDGEFKTPTVSDLVDYYQRNKAVDRRFEDANDLKQRLESDQKKHTDQVGKVTQYATSFVDNIKNGYFRDAIYDLCRITGQEPDEQWEALQGLQQDTAKRLQDMTDEDIESHHLKEENEFYRRQNRKKESDESKQNLEKANRVDVLEATNKWGITEDTYTKGSDYVDHMAAQGKIAKDAVTPQLKAEVGWDLATLDLIDQTITEELPEKRGNWELYNEILQDTKKKNLSMEDWKTVIRNVKEGSKKKERQSAIKRKVATAKPSQLNKSQEESQKLDTLEWDEI